MKTYTNLQNNSLKTLKPIRNSLLLTLFFLISFASNSIGEKISNDSDESSPMIDPVAICQNFSTFLDYSGTKAISPFNVNGGSFDPDGNIIDFSLDKDFFTCDDLGENLVTLTVEDNDGNTATCTATVTISWPSQTLACFSQVNLSLGMDGTGILEPEDVLAGTFFDPCDLFTVTPSFFTCDDIGTHSVIVDDGAGNSCWLTVLVEDKIPPTFIYPEDITLQCGGATDPSVTGEPVIIDNCANFGISYNDQIFNLIGDNIKILREWSIIDWITGDIETYIQVIQTEDNQAPTAICVSNLNVSLDQFGMVTLAPEAVDAGSFDDCGDVTLAVSPSSFDCSYIGDTVVVTLTVTDESGNTNLCWSTVVIEDKQGPTAVCNAEVTVLLGADGTASISPDVIDAGSYDNCGPLTYELSDSTFDCSNIGDTLIIFLTVTDGSGNTNQCWTEITVESDGISVDDIYWPEDIILACNADTDPSVTGEPQVLDNCGNFGISYQDDIFELDGNNIKILREWTVIDWITGEIFVYIQIIKTEDNQAPVAICAANLNIALDQFGMATLTPEAVDEGSYDDCGDVTLAVSPSSFDCSHIGDTIVVILTVTDESGNTNQCWTEVMVEDKQGPTAVCNAVVNVSLGADGTATITPDVIDAGSYDNCGPVNLSIDQSTFDCADILNDSLIVILTVTDQSGNTNQCWTQIVVEDKLAPTVTCPPDLTLDCSLAGDLDPELTGYPTVVDNCDLIGYAYEDQYLPLAGASFKVLRTWTVVDWFSGSVQECIQVINVLDITPPELICVSSLVASLDFTGNLTLYPDDFVQSVSDDCDSVSFSIPEYYFDCSAIGDSTVIITALDGSGNSSQCLVDITIEDKTSPIAICEAQVNVSLGADGTATITPDVIDAGSYDECGPVTLAIDQSTFDCGDILNDSLIVILTVTDQSGNTNQCWTQIVVEDKLAPTVTCPPDITLECSLAGDLNPDLTGYPTVVDNCDQIGIAYEDDLLPLEGSNYKVLRTWTVVDWYSGSIQECSQVISVFDLTPPEMMCINALSATLDANNELTLFPADFDLGTTDACGDITLTIDQSEFDCSDVGATIITLTATDENGNFSECMIDLMIFGMDADEDGFSLCDNDCNDNDASIFPGAPEVCGDNIDNNCNGDVDENCICASYGESTQYEWIESISVNATTSATGDDGGYGDYTGTTLEMNYGNNSVQLVPGFSGAKYREYWSIWIDFNHNGLFDANEEVLNENSKNTINGNISIPVSALAGPATMRIAMKYNSYSDPCEIFPEGEVEDYTVNINAPLYCLSGGESTQYEWIKKVRLKSINNQSGNDNGYADFTNLSTNLNPGQSKNIKLKPGFSGNSYVENWRVWVDWNEDGDFDDAGELEVEVSSSGNITDQITVPNNATSGDKVMRVSMKYGGYADPCEVFTYGEVEDYTIFVTGPDPLVSNNTSMDLISSANTQSQIITDDVIDKRSFDTQLKLRLYPNPTTNFINIELNSTNNVERKITIYNQVGQVVYQTTIDQDNHLIDVTGSKFTNGMYIVLLQQGEQVISKKIIITK